MAATRGMRASERGRGRKHEHAMRRKERSVDVCLPRMCATHHAELWKQNPQRPEQRSGNTTPQRLWFQSRESMNPALCPVLEGPCFRIFESVSCGTPQEKRSVQI